MGEWAGFKERYQGLMEEGWWMDVIKCVRVSLRVWLRRSWKWSLVDKNQRAAFIGA